MDGLSDVYQNASGGAKGILMLNEQVLAILNASDGASAGAALFLDEAQLQQSAENGQVPKDTAGAGSGTGTKACEAGAKRCAHAGGGIESKPRRAYGAGKAASGRGQRKAAPDRGAVKQAAAHTVRSTTKRSVSKSGTDEIKSAVNGKGISGRCCKAV